MVEERDSGKRLAGVGSLILAWTFFDGLILGLPILFVEVFLGLPLIVFAIGAAIWALLNIGAGTWIEREWDAWIVGTRFEAKLERMRNGKKATRAIGWITRGSPIFYALAGVATSASQTIAFHRLVAGHPAERSRFLAAALGPAIFWTALFTAVGYAAHQAI